MGDRASSLGLAHPIALPWAPVDPIRESSADADQDPKHVQPRGAPVAAEQLGISPDAPTPPELPPETVARLPEELRSHGLPPEPGPTIPEEDRVGFDQEDLVAAAVALDVLSTITRPTRENPAILHQLTRALCLVGELGGIDPTTREELLRRAIGPEGVSRERLNRALASKEGQAGPGMGQAGFRSMSSPSSVVGAIRQVERTSRTVVREARLLLQAAESVDYWQA